MKNILILILIGVGGWFAYEKVTSVDEFSNGEYKNSKHNVKITIPPSWSASGTPISAMKFATSKKVESKAILSPLSHDEIMLSISVADFSSPDITHITPKEWRIIKKNISKSGILTSFNNVETYNGIKVFRISGTKDEKYYEYVMFSSNEELYQLLFKMNKNLVERFKKDKFKILKGIKKYK